MEGTKKTAEGEQKQTKTKAEKGEKPQAAPEKKQLDNGLIISRELKVTKPLMKGKDVAAVQSALIEKRFHCGAEGANGVYGASTALAVRHFQAMNGLIVSGRVERFTIAALGGSWED